MFNGSGYYWVNRRGIIHYKQTRVVDAIGAEIYFNSPNCIKYWKVQTLDDYNKVIEIIRKSIRVESPK